MVRQSLQLTPGNIPTSHACNLFVENATTGMESSITFDSYKYNRYSQLPSLNQNFLLWWILYITGQKKVHRVLLWNGSKVENESHR